MGIIKVRSGNGKKHAVWALEYIQLTCLLFFNVLFPESAISPISFVLIFCGHCIVSSYGLI